MTTTIARRPLTQARAPWSWIALVVLSAVVAACGSSSEPPRVLDVPFGPGENLAADATADGPTIDVGLPGPDGSMTDDASPAEVSEEGAFDGAACDADDECAGGTCLASPEFPDGYCTQAPCELDEGCGDQFSSCVSLDDRTFCAVQCRLDEDCRAGYTCVADDVGEAVCLPEPRGEDLVDGSPCTEDDQCRGGSCLTEPRWPRGYCTTTGCRTRDDCATDGEDNRCLIDRSGRENFCVRICDEAADCREGYVCQPVGGGVGFCAPDPAQPIDLPEDVALELVCDTESAGTEHTFSFDIAEDAFSYMVTPIALDGRTVEARGVRLPDGDAIDFGRANSFQTATAQLFGFINPTIVPAIPDFDAQLQPGAHEYVLGTRSSELCYYLLEEPTPGTTIDFNVYLVGVPGLSVETAERDPDLQAVFDVFEEIYAAADVSIGTIRYTSVDADDETRYQVVRSQQDVANLVALSEMPGETLDAQLSVNIFFVRQFAFGDGSQAIGVSMGIPGPAGLHGTFASGLAFTSEFLGERFRDGSGETVDGNAFTGVVLAHEVGHYLGMFHTSEQFGQGFDPLRDTEECRDGFPGRCPDLENLMFPLAGVTHRGVTEGQAWMIRANPLTKE